MKLPRGAQRDNLFNSFFRCLSDLALICSKLFNVCANKLSLTELLEHAFFQPYAIQRIQLAEVDWEFDNKGFERKRGWVVCIESWTTFSVLV